MLFQNKLIKNFRENEVILNKIHENNVIFIKLM